MKMKITVTLKPEDLVEIMTKLGGQEDYGIITKTLEVEQTKANIEYLVKSEKIIDWDFTDGSTKQSAEVGPSRVYQDTPRTEKKEEISKPKPEITTPDEVAYEDSYPSNRWEGKRMVKIPRVARTRKKETSLKALVEEAYQDSFSVDDIYNLLCGLWKVKAWDEESFPKVIASIMADPMISGQDESTLLDFLDVMFNSMTSKERIGYLCDCIEKSWARAEKAESFMKFFEEIFSTKICR